MFFFKHWSAVWPFIPRKTLQSDSAIDIKHCTHEVRKLGLTIFKSVLGLQQIVQGNSKIMLT